MTKENPFQTELDRRGFMAALIASAIAAGVPLPARVEPVPMTWEHTDIKWQLWTVYFNGEKTTHKMWVGS